MIKQTLKKLSNLAHDKLLHFAYGTLLGFLCVLLFSWGGIFTMIFISAIKEFLDYFMYQLDGKEYDIREGCIDALVTVIPSILFSIIILVHQIN